MGLALVLMAGLGVVGCGRSDLPELGKVEGTVTMDGKPLSSAVITFLPEQGRPAVANTDSEGYYELMYTADTKGATVGPNEVRVLWSDDAPGPFPIPDKYNNRSELKADVQPGRNTFDFDLKST